MNTPNTTDWLVQLGVPTLLKMWRHPGKPPEEKERIARALDLIEASLWQRKNPPKRAATPEEVPTLRQLPDDDEPTLRILPREPSVIVDVTSFEAMARDEARRGWWSR